MKQLLSICLLLGLVQSVQAVDDYSFKCAVGKFEVVSQPGLKKAPDHPVVELKIKVLKQQVPLYLISTDFTKEVSGPKGPEKQISIKSLFVTDWIEKVNLSQEGEELLMLLSFFYGYDTASVTHLRAGIPSDILEDFQYLELKFQDDTVIKLGFEGINPEVCI